MKNEQTALRKPGEPRMTVRNLQNIPGYNYQIVLKLSSDLLFIACDNYQTLPRESKNSIGKNLKENLTELTTLLCKITKTAEQSALLEEAFGCLEVIGLRIRLLYGFNQLSAEQFTLMDELTDEIYRQLLIWRKDIRKRKA